MDSNQTLKADEDVVILKGGGSHELRSYEQLKFDLADVIREASSKASELKNDELQRKLRELLRRIAEDRFYVTFAGQFSRGKTTLINAMLGMDRLPTGIVPITSVITAVSYDAHERVVLHFEGSHLTQDISLDELPEWITERGNPGNRERIERAEVQLPSDFLRRGAFLVDTPGLGSAVIENTKTTKDFLPQIDALLLITSFEFPLSAEEIAFLRAARAQRCKMFVIVNKFDLCSAAQRDQVFDFIRSRVLEEAGDREVQIFALSASQALAARLAKDEEGLERSGLLNFEKALVHYLVTEKSRDFVLATCDCLDLLPGDFDSAHAANLTVRLEAIKSEAINKNEAHAQSEKRPGSGKRATAYQSGTSSPCTICAYVVQATYDFMRRFQYDLACRVETQVQHAAASGFCGLHTWQYFRLASPQGMAAGYSKTLSFAVKTLRRMAERTRSEGSALETFEEVLPSEEKCCACHCADDAEQKAIEEFLRKEHARQARESDGLPCLCLMHLAVLTPLISDGQLAIRLIECQANARTTWGESTAVRLATQWLAFGAYNGRRTTLP